VQSRYVQAPERPAHFVAFTALLWLVITICGCDMLSEFPAIYINCYVYIFKESLIAFSLSRLWRWTAAPRLPRCLSPLLGPVSALLSINCYTVTPGTDLTTTKSGIRLLAVDSHWFCGCSSNGILPREESWGVQLLRCIYQSTC